MYSFYLAVLSLLMFSSNISTFKRQDRPVDQTYTKNWVESTNTEVISLQKNNKNVDLQLKLWRQQNKFVEPSEIEGVLANRFRFQTKIKNMLAVTSVNGKILRPNLNDEISVRNEENTAVRPLMSENGRITRPTISDMTIKFQGNRKPIKDKKNLEERTSSFLSHLMDETLSIPDKGYIRSDRLSDWLSETKREDIPLNAMMTKCAVGEIKLTKTFVCVPCTVFADLEDNVCGMRDFQQVCLESWTKACGLDRAAPTVPARIRNPQDYELLNEQIQSA